jgi:hypothetical protein
LVRVMLAGSLLGVAAFFLTRTGQAASLPLTPLSDVAQRAAEHPIVRTTGDMVGDDGQPVALQRLQIDTGSSAERPVHWRDVLHGQGLNPPEPAYDMVSPPRVRLVDGAVSVLLQTEDIDLRFWPPEVDTQLAIDQPYPALTLLPTLPDLPARAGAAAHLRLWQFPQHARVTVVGQVVLEGETPDLQSEPGQPFIISPLPYERVVALERQVSKPNLTVGALCLLGAGGIVLGLLRRRR